MDLLPLLPARIAPAVLADEGWHNRKSLGSGGCVFRIKESTTLVPSQALLSKRSLHSPEVTHLCVFGLKCLTSSCGTAGYCRVKVCPQGPDLKGPVSKYSNTLRYWC